MNAATQCGDSETLAQAREAVSGYVLAAEAAAADTVSVVPSDGGSVVPMARAMAIATKLRAACAGMTSSATDADADARAAGTPATGNWLKRVVAAAIGVPLRRPQSPYSYSGDHIRLG